MKGERRLLRDTIVLGVVGALSAQAFMLLLHLAQEVLLKGIAGYTAPGLPEEGGVLLQVIGPHGLWLIPLVTTLGGLISGILVYSLAPEAEGHGTDTAVKAFHQAAGFIRARVAPLKMVASAITIGAGGSAGREGPTALISAGVGSIYGTWTHRSDDERRLLILIGMAAGLAAIFRSPIGTAFFAIEVLYSDMEFDARALLYTMLGSIVAYAVNGLFVGYHPLFNVPPGLEGPEFLDYLWYGILGISAGLLAALIPGVFYGIRDAFHALPVPPHVKPAIGGLGVGLIAIALPQVLGGGYGWLQEAIDGRMALGLMIALLFAKTIAFSLTVSSGGSGGIFAPCLFVGGMLGGILGRIFHQPSSAFVFVGMAAVFGGAARVPIAAVLMVTEMTGGYAFLVPAALAVMLSYLLQVRLSARLRYRSMYEGQVPGRPDSPAHHIEHLEAVLHLLSEQRFSVPASVTHLDLRALIASGIPIDLPGGKQLIVAALKEESPCVGKPMDCWSVLELQEDIEIVALFRKGETVLPRPDLKLQARDRLLIIASPEARGRLAEHFSLSSP